MEMAAGERCKYNARSSTLNAVGALARNIEYLEQQAASARRTKTSFGWASAWAAYAKGVLVTTPMRMNWRNNKRVLFFIPRHFLQLIRQQLQNPSQQAI